MDVSINSPSQTAPTRKEIGVQAYDPIAPTYIPQPKHRRHETPAYENSEFDDHMELDLDYEEVEAKTSKESLCSGNYEVHRRQWEIDSDFSGGEGHGSKVFAFVKFPAKIVAKFMTYGLDSAAAGA